MIIRYASAIATGTLMTLALLFVMQLLISLEPVNSSPIEVGRLTIGRTIVEEPVVPDDEKTEFPELKEPVDTEPRPTPDMDFGPGLGISVPLTTRAPANRMPEFGVGVSDSPLVAYIRVQPYYPDRAVEQGLEGWVVAEFDVLPDGSVTNITIVESSHRIFESAAIKAAKRFRYKAKVVDGVPQTTRGVRSRFTFEMERG